MKRFPKNRLSDRLTSMDSISSMMAITLAQTEDANVLRSLSRCTSTEARFGSLWMSLGQNFAFRSSLSSNTLSGKVRLSGFECIDVIADLACRIAASVLNLGSNTLSKCRHMNDPHIVDESRDHSFLQSCRPSTVSKHIGRKLNHRVIQVKIEQHIFERSHR